MKTHSYLIWWLILNHKIIFPLYLYKIASVPYFSYSHKGFINLCFPCCQVFLVAHRVKWPALESQLQAIAPALATTSFLSRYPIHHSFIHPSSQPVSHPSIDSFTLAVCYFADMTAGWAIFKTVRNYFCQYMGNGRRRQRRRLLRRHYPPRPWYLTNYRPTFDSSSKTEKNIRNPKKATKTKLKNSKQTNSNRIGKKPSSFVCHSQWVCASMTQRG